MVGENRTLLESAKRIAPHRRRVWGCAWRITPNGDEAPVRFGVQGRHRSKLQIFERIYGRPKEGFGGKEVGRSKVLS